MHFKDSVNNWNASYAASNGAMWGVYHRAV